jgi:hypothetical protein
MIKVLSYGTIRGAAGVLILLLALVGSGASNPAKAQEPSQAMQAFIQAMVRKNPAAILSAFSRQAPWKYQPYEIGSNRRLQAATITPEKLARDFQQQTGWYDFFMSEPNGYTFRVNFMGNNRWHQRGADTFVAPDSDSGHTYIKWQREGQKWLIGEIGETTP